MGIEIFSSYQIAPPFILSAPIFSQSCAQRFAQNAPFCASFKILFVRAPNNTHARNNWQQRLSLASASFHSNKNHRATKTTQQWLRSPSLSRHHPHSLNFVLSHSQWLHSPSLSRLRSPSISRSQLHHSLSPNTTELMSLLRSV